VDDLSAEPAGLLGLLPYISLLILAEFASSFTAVGGRYRSLNGNALLLLLDPFGVHILLHVFVFCSFFFIYNTV